GEVVQEGDDHHLVQVEAGEHLRVPHHAVHLQGLVEGDEQRVEEVAGERQVGREMTSMNACSRERVRVMFASVSSSTTRPSLMMTTLSQTCATSGRICVESTTVRLPPSVLMRLRISMICRGSSPIVGSSRTSTGW